MSENTLELSLPQIIKLPYIEEYKFEKGLYIGKKE